MSMPPVTSTETAANDLGVTVDAPWLGLRSFTEEVREFFFGRDAEIQALFDRVQHRTLTVLFGQSGLGKTSLLQAGLIPMLRDAGFIPIAIRLVHDKSAKPLQVQIVRAIADKIPSVHLPPSAEPTLWELFHDPAFGLTAAERVPVLIIDQFEELFTLGENKRPEDARDFFESLACVVENRPPAAIRAAIDRDDDLAGRFRLRPQPCKVLLVLREDFLSRLERGRPRMPSMMDNRLELRLLSGPQAFRAVYEPGAKHPLGPIVTRETARAIVRFVAGAPADKPLEEIDNVPPLLSLICEQLNSRRLARGEPTIRTESLTDSAPEVLRNFYVDSFAPHPAAVREYVEDKLVSDSGFRESKRLDEAKKFLTKAGVRDPEAALRQLVDQRLLVIEDRGGVMRVELTHDILAPIAAAARQERETNQRRLETFRKWLRQLAVSALGLAALAGAGLVIRDQFEQQEQAMHARGLVLSILNSETVHVPGEIQEILKYRKWIEPLLRQKRIQIEAAAINERQQLNISLARLALLPVDETQTDRLRLYDGLLNAAPDEFSVIRDALYPHKDELLGKLWAVAESPEKGKESQRLRAASALATYDTGSQRWTKARNSVGQDLVGVPAIHLVDWMKAFRPVAATLVDPLTEIFRESPHDVERSLATAILADYTAGDPKKLTELVLDADPIQFDIIYRKFEMYCEVELPALTEVIKQTLADIDQRLPSHAEDEEREKEKEKLAKRQANAAAILLRMRRDADVWPLFKHCDDPRTRSYLIHRMGLLDVPPETIIKRLENDQEPNITIRRALLLCLGEFREEKLPPHRRNALRPKLRELYRTAVDPGIHAAVGWLLLQWNDEAWLNRTNEEWAKDNPLRAQRLATIESSLASDKEDASPQWYVNSQGQTMVIIPGPREFQMGSPDGEMAREDDETRHTVRIGRSFAIAAAPITVKQYQEFDEKYEYSPKVTRPKEVFDSPVVRIEWYEAALYCIWLSEQDNIPREQWCYEMNEENGERKVTGLRKGYLGLSGYRLPTEAEVECATRAGALTARCFGETDELLPKYACYVKNSQRRLQRIGKLKPNDFGLFDVHGNANTWCQEVFKPYPNENDGVASEDVEDSLEISPTEPRMFRGGSYKDDASLVRSAYRNTIAPNESHSYLGCRPVRTIAPSAPAR